MTRLEAGRTPWWRAPLVIARGSALSVYDHWALALFSLVAAFSIWFVIQDVENPRVRQAFPVDGTRSIPVEAENGDNYLPDKDYSVSVVVEGREGILKTLKPSDFEARVDIKGIPPGVQTTVPVKVRSTKDGVSVVSVDPPSINLTLEELETRTFKVQDNQQGQLPAGLVMRVTNIEPLAVEVRGLARQLDSIASVDIDVNLAGLTEGTNSIENELKARGIGNREIAVAITPARGKATYEVEQSFIQRSLPVNAPTTGQVAAGYRIVSQSVDPPTVSVSGPAGTVSGMTQLLTQPIDVSNANSEIRLIRSIDVQNSNVSLERRQVTVRIDIRPIECGSGSSGSLCGGVTLQVPAQPTDQPPNLVVTSPLYVNVVLTGPLPGLSQATPSMITAKVSLAGGQPGQGLFPVSVTLSSSLTSAGVKAEQPGPITVQLAPP